MIPTNLYPEKANMSIVVNDVEMADTYIDTKCIKTSTIVQARADDA